MTEAVAALGVAAAAVQFFDFSLKALSLCKQIRDSEKGATQANLELESCARKLKQIFDELKPDARLTATDRPITTARQDCVAVVGDLQKLLDDVKLKSRDNNLAAVKAAFRVMKGRKAIEVLQNRLSEAQNRFLAAVSVDTRDEVARLLKEQGKITHTMHNAILPELRKTHASSVSNHAKTHKELTKMTVTSSAAHQTTQRMLQSAQKGQKASRKQLGATHAALSGSIARIEVQATRTFSSVQTATKHKDFLESLWYPEIFDRQQNIRPPSYDTFGWIFDGSPRQEEDVHDKSGWRQSQNPLREQMRGEFARWLRSDELLFWVSGKAGSGKSSLMSMIQDDLRTAEALSTWANGRRLHTFSFYFWRPGSALQKTIYGLLRSLLYQLAKAKPAVIDLVLSTKPPAHNDWTTRSLIAAFRCALSAFHNDCLFLMVDGLDEYEDQYNELLDLLLECQQMPFIKTCIASRPETAILAKLKSFPSLRLQDLNARDIEIFVTGRLGPYTNLITEEIMLQVAYRAEGVFLWAVLVVASMLSGALDGDDEETLQKRLDTTPNELNALFTQLLTKVNDVHYDTMKLCLYHLADKLSGYNAYRCSIGLITASMPASRAIGASAEFRDLCVKNPERLIAICKGLIETDFSPWGVDLTSASSAWNFDFRTKRLIKDDLCKVEICYETRIQFVHRSAYDFFFGPEADKHSLWALREEDLGRLAVMTLSGARTLLRYGPMLFVGLSFQKHPNVSWLIALASQCMQHIGSSKTVNIFEWLDEARKDTGDWYGPERRSLSYSNFLSVEAEPSWAVESQFWEAACLVDGYLEARWDKFARAPHARAICSRMLCALHRVFMTIEDSTHERLLAFLEKTHVESASTGTEHIRKHDVSRDLDDCLLLASWDSSGAMDERHVMANLIDTAMDMHVQSHKQRRLSCNLSDPCMLLRKHNLFLGKNLLSPFRRDCLFLHIQVPIRTWCLPQSQLEFASHESDYSAHFRLLYLKRRADMPMPYGKHEKIWMVATDFVGGCCDVHVEKLGASLERPGDRFEDHRATYPVFLGTQDQFDTCLEEVNEEIWADKKGQLDAWQQLCMLACVKREFKDFWTLVTPETGELAQITLGSLLDTMVSPR